MRLLTRPPGRGYAVAVLATGLALLARTALDPWLGNRQAFSTFYLAVAAASWVGGLRSGLVALGLGAMAGIFFFVEPRGSLQVGTAGDALALLTFLAVGLAIPLLIRRGGAAGAEAARGGFLRPGGPPALLRLTAPVRRSQHDISC